MTTTFLPVDLTTSDDSQVHGHFPTEDFDSSDLAELLKSGLLKKAKELIQHPTFDIYATDQDALEKAITLGFIDCAELLIEKNAPLNRLTSEGCSLLQIVLDREYFPLAETMLKHGAEITIRDNKGWTPLIWAAISGREKIVDFLLYKNADVHVCNNDGWNAITGAYAKRHLSIVQKLKGKGAYFGQKYADAVLLSSFKDAQKDLFTQLVKDGANVNLTTDKGDPLLSLAISRGDLESVNLLLEHGADPNARLGSGTTCLNHALGKSHYAIAKALLIAGADPNDSGKESWSPLHHAANGGCAEICRILIEKGASINKQTDNKEKWTPLMLAANELHLEATQELCELGADLNLRNGNSQRALSLAHKSNLSTNKTETLLANKGALM